VETSLRAAPDRKPCPVELAPGVDPGGQADNKSRLWAALDGAIGQCPELCIVQVFGRRPPQPVEGFVMPASKNLHTTDILQEKLYCECVRTH